MSKTRTQFGFYFKWNDTANNGKTQKYRLRPEGLGETEMLFEGIQFSYENIRKHCVSTDARARSMHVRWSSLGHDALSKWNSYSSSCLPGIYMLWIQVSAHKTLQASAKCFFNSLSPYCHIWVSNTVQYNNPFITLKCPEVSHMNNWGTRWSKELSKFFQEASSTAET